MVLLPRCFASFLSFFLSFRQNIQFSFLLQFQTEKKDCATFSWVLSLVCISHKLLVELLLWKKRDDTIPTLELFVGFSWTKMAAAAVEMSASSTHRSSRRNKVWHKKNGDRRTNWLEEWCKAPLYWIHWAHHCACRWGIWTLIYPDPPPSPSRHSDISKQKTHHANALSLGGVCWANFDSSKQKIIIAKHFEIRWINAWFRATLKDHRTFSRW